jgi:hypothetical protein
MHNFRALGLHHVLVSLTSVSNLFSNVSRNTRLRLVQSDADCLCVDRYLYPITEHRVNMNRKITSKNMTRRNGDITAFTFYLLVSN